MSTPQGPTPALDPTAIAAGLPVGDHLAELRAGLGRGRLVVQAPPGTGKTTVVPALAASPEAGAAVRGRVVVTQPRRIAARAAARRLAALTGTAPGEVAAHTVRGESTLTGHSRVEFVTTGVLVRRLLADPDLPGVGTIVLDEVHERHVDSDLLVGMVGEVAQLRDDLTVVAMSATLDARRWVDLLGGEREVALVEVASALHPLDVRWAPPSVRAADQRGATPAFLDYLTATTVEAVRRLGPDGGSALVFVPGAREVERTVAGLRQRLPGHAVRGLSGRMSPRDQDEALSGDGPAVVVATSVAESSLTVPGVRLVVDSGLARQPRVDRGRRTTGLVTVRESRAAAVQRAGRAARLGPGTVVRCLRREDWAGMDAEPTPEVDHADLTSAVLTLACWGSPRGEGMSLPSPLPAERVAEAERDLRALGALDGEGRATARGRTLAGLPTDPRLARALVDGSALLDPEQVAQVVALLDADLRPDDGDLVALWRRLRTGGEPSSGRWRREARRLARACRAVPREHTDGAHPPELSGGPAALDDAAVVAAVVALAHPGRIARRREATSYLTAEGVGVEVPRGSALIGQPWLAVAETSRALWADGPVAVVRSAAPLDEEVARWAGQELLGEDESVEWRDGRVVARRVRRLGAIELSATPVRPDADRAREAVRRAVCRHGLGEGSPVRWDGRGEAMRRRLAVVHRVMGGPWPDVADAALVERLDEWVDVDALARSSRVDLAAGLQALVGWPLVGALDELAPERLEVPTGSRIRLDYPPHDEEDGPVVLAVKLQECFGWSQVPTICAGRLPVVLHLLSPAGRPLAVTGDLTHFWNEVYPAVRAENRARYAKHPWPEDPWTVRAMRGTKKSGR